MHDFQYRNGELYCEGLPVARIAAKVGTPFYLYSHTALTSRFLELSRAFQPLNALICFSMKANSNLAVIKSLVDKGSGLDVVSGGELFRALKIGCDPKKIVFAGVGKTDAEISRALDAGIFLFNVESLPELVAINRVAGKKKKRANVSLRLNPDVDPKTHRHISTGKKESKFGIDMESAFQIYLEKEKYPFVTLEAAHVHIGSQITTGDPFVTAIKKVLAFIRKLEARGVEIKTLNLGGGLGVTYKDENPQTALEYGKRIIPLFKGTRFAAGSKKGRLVFEPGRFIVANSGIFVTRLIYHKKNAAKNFLIVDGAMNDLIRPSLYDAYHHIMPVKAVFQEKNVKSDVVGPVCESGDYFAKDRVLPQISPGDMLAVFGAGAYGFAMSSQYNSRPRVPEVMVKGKKFEVVRKRETLQDLIRGEKIPSFLL